MTYNEINQIIKKEKYVTLIFTSEKDFNSENLGKTIHEFLKSNQKMKIYTFGYNKDYEIARNFPINKFPTTIIYKKGKKILLEDNLKHRLDIAHFVEKLPKNLKK